MLPFFEERERYFHADHTVVLCYDRADREWTAVAKRGHYLGDMRGGFSDGVILGSWHATPEGAAREIEDLIDKRVRARAAFEELKRQAQSGVLR
jgi:hypothetical protein